MSTAFRSVLSHELATLQTCAPWCDVPAGQLQTLLVDAELRFFPRGATILNPELMQCSGQYLILHRGQVVAHDMTDAPEPPHPLLELHPGALLPVFAPRSALGAGLCHLAVTDVFCWQIGDAAHAGLRQLPCLLQWQLAQADRLFEARRSRWHDSDQASRTAAQIMGLPLSEVSGPPVQVACATPIADAVALMDGWRTGSVVVTEAARPIGILTESDLLHRVMAPGHDLNGPVGDVMTATPRTIAASATVAEAALEMGAHRIRHLPVVDDTGRLAGMVSERDVFALQRGGFGYLAAPLEQARNLDELAQAVEGVRTFATHLFRHGMAPASLTAVISTLNDRVVGRVIALTTRADETDLRYCWLAFGSEGRQEQTFSTDQDNGIVFATPDGNPQSMRDRLLELAERINVGLDRCGFPLCKGNVMARNPRWCLTLDEWRARFSSWVRTPEPEALLNANIFFDFRAIHGKVELADALTAHMFSLTMDNRIFLAMLAENALSVAPPIGKLSRFSTDGGEYAGTIDLKRQGVRMFIDAGRVFALDYGVRATNTAQRLRLGEQKMRRNPRAVEADIAAFNFVQEMRLRGQLAHAPDSPLDPNRIDPYALNEIEQRILRESMHQAQLLQARLRMEYLP